MYITWLLSINLIIVILIMSAPNSKSYKNQNNVFLTVLFSLYLPFLQYILLGIFTNLLKNTPKCSHYSNNYGYKCHFHIPQFLELSFFFIFFRFILLNPRISLDFSISHSDNSITMRIFLIVVLYLLGFCVFFTSTGKYNWYSLLTLNGYCRFY